MSEDNGKRMESLDFQGLRKSLLSALSDVIVTSKQKFDTERSPNADRLKWGKLVCIGCETYSRLLQVAEIQNLEARISRLESYGELKNENQEPRTKDPTA
jgi:hypothetical protein